MMAGNLSPPFFEGILGPTVYVRSVGEWLSWEDTVAEQNIPLPASHPAGDLLIVFGCGVAGFTAPEVSGWTRVYRNALAITVFHARWATGDSNDNFLAPAITSTGGQGGGMYQMASIAGLDWSGTFDDIASDYTARHQDIIYSALGAGSVDDSLVLVGVHKQWGTGGKDPYPAGGIDQPAADAGTGISAGTSFNYQQGADRELIGDWHWRYDEGPGTAISQGSLNQNPLDDGGPPTYTDAGSCYLITVRLYVT